MNPTIISYKHLRVVIGILAISITWICILGSLFFGKEEIQTSISAYYYTNMRDFLEAVLMGVSAFLLCYMGYSLLDRMISMIAGLFGICIALFPCYKDKIIPIGIFQIQSNISDTIHLITASIFFGLLAFMSIFLFTKTNKILYDWNRKNNIFSDERTPQKKIRNIIYIVCGIMIIVSGALIGLLALFLGKDTIDKYHIVLICETVILHAFGFSWLIKSQIIFKDRPLKEKIRKTTKEGGDLNHG